MVERLLDKRRVRANFEASAETYDGAAFLQREIADRLLERLDLMKLQPQRILDLGAGTGHALPGLRQRYKKSQLVALDLAANMLHKAKKRGGWFDKPTVVCADAEALPLAEHSLDLVFSSLTLQWCDELGRVFTELRRVLQSDGLLMFSTLGPDTLKELRHSWAAVDENPHVNRFLDMHDVGDALVQAGFADPVMDREILTITYASVRELLRDLQHIGAVNAAKERQRGLMTAERLKKMEQAYEQFRQADGRYPLTYEVVYGHAWVPDAPAPSQQAQTFPVKVVAR